MSEKCSCVTLYNRFVANDVTHLTAAIVTMHLHVQYWHCCVLLGGVRLPFWGQWRWFGKNLANFQGSAHCNEPFGHRSVKYYPKFEKLCHLSSPHPSFYPLDTNIREARGQVCRHTAPNRVENIELSLIRWKNLITVCRANFSFASQVKRCSVYAAGEKG